MSRRIIEIYPYDMPMHLMDINTITEVLDFVNSCRVNAQVRLSDATDRDWGWRAYFYPMSAAKFKLMVEIAKGDSSIPEPASEKKEIDFSAINKIMSTH